MQARRRVPLRYPRPLMTTVFAAATRLRYTVGRSVLLPEVASQDEWVVLCDTHGVSTGAPSREQAMATANWPTFCPACKPTLDRITAQRD